jgi:hypothetical protein
LTLVIANRARRALMDLAAEMSIVEARLGARVVDVSGDGDHGQIRDLRVPGTGRIEGVHHLDHFVGRPAPSFEERL